MTILVVGSTGFVGSALVQALCAEGETVRAGSRRPTAPLPSPARWVPCDLERPETLSNALAGAECAYYLAHSMGKDHPDFRKTERRCAEDFAQIAAEQGCRRIIYLGGVAPRGTPSEHLASRLEVGAILRAGAVPTIELRASMIIGNGGASWRILRDLAVRLPFMVFPRWLDSRTCPIALPDAITALLDAREVPLDRATWFDIPGPDDLSVREMLMIVGALEGRRIPNVRVPVLTPKLSALWLRLITGADYHLARELVLGLGSDLLPDSAAYWEVTQHPPRWSFREAAANALSTERPPRRAVRVVEALVRRLGPHLKQPQIA